jgi:hypothetical protein
MIDLKVQTIGGEEIARELEAGPGAIRSAIRGELAKVGDEIVSRAQALAPKKSGIMASKVLWYFGSEATSKQRRKMGLNRFGSLDADRGPVRFTARPTGSVAHLMERGVNTTRKLHPRRVERTARIWTRKGRKLKTFKATALVKAHPFNIAPHPFFMPAVASVGGAAGVNARLQDALTKAAGIMRGAA